jgi:surfeit locus 1 family protein
VKRVPVVATLVVVIAVAIMIRLGFWQLSRMHEKEALLARYAAAQTSSAAVRFPAIPAEVDGALYHRSQLDCRKISAPTSIAGRNARGESGLAQLVQCQDAQGGTHPVILGWSRSPVPSLWQGGMVTGWVAPGPKLVADPPLAGLDANARPDPNDIANNHLSYAVQWFLFALTAGVIYAIAVRKRMRG